MRKAFYMIFAAVMMCSCGIYTKYEPQTSVPDNLYGDSLSYGTDTASLGNVYWRELFTDTLLQNLIEEGLANNTDHKSAQLRIEEAEATLLAAKLAYLPSFAFAPQGSVSSFDNQKATQTYQLPITASWELDVFGRIRNAKLQAKALYAKSIDYKQAVRTQLIASIANAYYTLQMLDAQLDLTERTMASWEETVETARALMKAGQYNEAAVAQMEASLHGVRASVLDIKEQINQTENSLSIILGEAPQKHQRGKLCQMQLDCDITVGVPLQMLSNRPDVRSAERSLEAAFYATNQARSAFYPQITLSGSVGWTNAVGSAILNPGKFLAEALGSLTLPLFNKGQNVAQLRISKAQQEEARLAFQQALLNAGSEVNDALTAYQTSHAKTSIYSKQVESLQTALRSTKLLMQHGNTNYLEVLTAQQSLLNAELQQVANMFTEVQSVISLYQALGGGRD